MQEEWSAIAEFPGYMVSSFGRMARGGDREKLMSISKTNYGDLKATLTRNGEKVTRSMRVLVAEAFVQRPNELCDTVIILDGNRENVAFDNLAWRPRWFAWKYTRQQQEEQQPRYSNTPIINVATREWYASVVECGNKEGLLYDDIWRSAITGARIFPTGGPYSFE